MPGDDVAQAESVLKLAEAELAAFLAGLSFLPAGFDTVNGGAAWIDTMMALDWPERNHAGFFRLVSILTIACLTSHPAMSEEPLLHTVLGAPVSLLDEAPSVSAHQPS